MLIMGTISFPVARDWQVNLYDQIFITGRIFCGRDAVLPRIVECYRKGTLGDLGINLSGSVIFHTAVSPAGIGPTSSNKLDIESSIPALSEAGVKLHLGKGALKPKTVEVLKKYNSYFAVTPPVSALFGSRIISSRVVAFPELGMEAFYELEVKGIPAIIAIANGSSIFDQIGG